MQLNKLFARASTVFFASLLTAGTFLCMAVPASAAGVTQNPPTSRATTVDGSATFSDQLSALGDGNPVTFTTSVSDTGINVSPSGAVTTTGTPLAVGTYEASGTDADDMDTGIWSYSLNVAASTISQASPLSGSTTVGASTSFSDQLSLTGNNGAVTYTTTAVSTQVTVSSTGAVSTSGQLGGGTYTVSGTDSDVDGDTGVWTYTLTVAAPATPPGARALVQISPTAGATTTPNSAAFIPPQIAVADANGAVSFTTTTSSPGLKVTSSGIVSVTAALAAGSYTVAGSDQDLSGDAGLWTYTLTVTDPLETVTFDANGGTGSMTTQTEDQAAPLTKNDFTRAGYTFVEWSTSAKGVGTVYANAATYPFTAPLTLYARWKKGKVAFHTVTFLPHQGKGSMAVERENTATGLSSVKFTRKGYAFSNWNTKANGKGTRFANRVTYSFRKNLSLYAQWKKVARAPATTEYSVTFVANGGKGAMATEKSHTAVSLSPATFTRTGYAFLSWNTVAAGSGTSYPNEAVFPFRANVTLYAQWKKTRKTVTTPPSPPVHYGGLNLGPFASRSSTLTSGLQTQISAIAQDVKSEGKSQISLLGFGDNLSGAAATSAANVALGRARALAVANYLQTRLADLKLKGGWSISIGASGSEKSSSGQLESDLVQVALS
jgi:uncharacterized repeat protein (TIGR02543 family)